MKNFVTAIACMILLMTMVVQYGSEQVNHARISYAQKAIHNAKEIAKQEGCFTEENVANLKKSISEKFGLTEDEVVISATGPEDRKVRGELIHYSVTFPVKNYIGGATVWGISEEDNIVTKTYDFETTSEYLPR